MKTTLLILLLSSSAHAKGYMWDNEYKKCYETKGATQISKPISFDDKEVDVTLCEQKVGAEDELRDARITCPGRFFKSHKSFPSNEAFSAAVDHVQKGDFSFAELMATWQTLGCDEHPGKSDDEFFKFILDRAAWTHKDNGHPIHQAPEERPAADTDDTR